MFSFTLIYWKLATYKERLALEAALTICGSFVQEHKYRFDKKHVVYYMRTDDYPKFLRMFQEKFPLINEYVEVIDVKAA